jgi:hypothetical protein
LLSTTRLKNYVCETHVPGGTRKDHARQYIQSVTTSSPAEEIARLADLKANGTITQAEYEQLKAKALAS